MVIHCHLSPGGGFQGGVILAAALLTIYIAGSYEALRKIAPAAWLDPAESAAVTGLLAIGLFGLAAGRTYLENAIPQGTFRS